MNAETLHCQSCGAAVASESPVCAHCGARLAAISCPCCFGMMFRGMKFCPHCGTAAAQWESSGEAMPCPACAVPLLRGTLEKITLHECERCFGIWLDAATFECICRDAEQQAVVLPGAGLGPPSPAALATVRYRRCPGCAQLMNRINFSQRSGVVVDVCREHGTWFDRDELQRIVAFIRSGGLDRARERTKAELAAEVRRMESARRERVGSDFDGSPSPGRIDLLTLAVGSAGGLLGRWLRR